MLHGVVLHTSPKNNNSCYLLFEQPSSGHFHATPCVSSYLCSPSHDFLASTKLSLFQPPGVHKEPGLGENHQSHLCRCLDNTSPRFAFTSTSTSASGCSMPRPAELVPVSPCSCPPRGPQLFRSQVNCTSKIVLAQCDF